MFLPSTGCPNPNPPFPECFACFPWNFLVLTLRVILMTTPMKEPEARTPVNTLKNYMLKDEARLQTFSEGPAGCSTPKNTSENRCQGGLALTSTICGLCLWLRFSSTFLCPHGQSMVLGCRESRTPNSVHSGHINNMFFLGGLQCATFGTARSNMPSGSLLFCFY